MPLLAELNPLFPDRIAVEEVAPVRTENDIAKRFIRPSFTKTR